MDLDSTARGDWGTSRKPYDDKTSYPEDGRTHRTRDGEIDRRSHRSRSRDQERRRRSRTPASRSRSRERRPRSRDREKRRDRDRDYDRRRDRDRDRARESRRDRSRERGDGRRHLNDDDRAGRPSRRKSPAERSRSGGRRRDDSKEAHSSNGRSLIKRSGPLPSQNDSFAMSRGEAPEKPVEKPNFGNSGVLAAASNSVVQADGTTITLKYHEPPEARLPRDSWKLFVFKDNDIVETIDLSDRSCWLIGRELAVVDLPAQHPSISKQHAVIQFRYTEKRNEYGDKIGRVKPYLIDLESANGTMLNGSRVPESRYLELRNKDMIQFGSSTREYVLMQAPKD